MEFDLFENSILMLGLFLTLGYLLSLLLKKAKIPHIITFLLAGFLIANTLLRDHDTAILLGEWYHISENLALGLIGFKIGTELKFSMLKKNPKFIIVVLFAEVTMTFAVITGIIYLIWGDLLMAIILGGLGTATAPAATVEVLRKLKAKGPLTQRIQWILAFDDFVAVTIVEMILVYVTVTIGGTFNALTFFQDLFSELGVSIILGFAIGNALDMIIERMHDDIEMMELTIGVIVAAIGVAILLHTSVIVTTMMIGAVATNKSGHNYERVQDLLTYIMSPVIMIFFVLVGSKISLSDFNPFPWLALVYLLTRTLGKLGGSFIGTKVACKTPAIQKNLGFGLLAQGGVALGLVAIAADILAEAGHIELAQLILSTLIISTIGSEALGAVGTTFAVKRAGEDNKLDEIERETHFRGKEITELFSHESRLPSRLWEIILLLATLIAAGIAGFILFL